MIIINNITIPFEGTTDLLLLSRLFNEMESYSFPFGIPWCDELKKATYYSNHPDTDIIGNSFTCTISCEGLTLSGLITITDCSDDELEVAFVDNATFYGKITNKLLTELRDEIIELGIDKPKTLSDSLKEDNYKFVCPPFNNSKITEGWGLNVPEQCNVFNTTTEQLDSENKIIVPMPYLWHIFRRIFNDNGYTINSELQQNDYYKKLFVYSNVSIARQSYSKHTFEFENWTVIKITNEEEPILSVLIPMETKTYSVLTKDDTEPVMIYEPGELPPSSNPQKCMQTAPKNTKPITITNFRNLITRCPVRIYSSNPATNKTTIEPSDKILFESSWTDGPGEWIEFQKNDDGTFEELERGTIKYPAPIKNTDVFMFLSQTMTELNNRAIQFECEEDGSYNVNFGGLTYDFKIPFIDSTDFRKNPRLLYSITKIIKGATTKIYIDEEFEQTGSQFVSIIGGRIETGDTPVKFYCDGNIYNCKKTGLQDFTNQNLFKIRSVSNDKKCLTVEIDTQTWGDDILSSSLGLKVYTAFSDYIYPAHTSYGYEDINLTKHLPNIEIVEFLKAIQNYLGWICFVNEATSTCYIKRIDKILSSTNVIDLSKYASSISFNVNEASEFGLSLVPENDNSFSEIKELPEDAIIKSQVATPIDLPEIENDGVFRLVVSNNYIYQFTYQIMGSGGIWKKYSYNIKMVEGRKEFQESIASHLFYDNQNNQENIIKSEQAGTNYALWNYLERNTPLLIGHYEGLKQIGEVKKPLVSISDPLFSNLEHNLTLDKGTNLYDKIWKPYFYWQEKIRRDGIVTIQWPAYIISSLKLWEKIKIGTTCCLVKEIPVSMDHKTDKLSFGETKVVRC